MSKEIRTSLWVEDEVTRIRTFLEDFDGTVEEWKKAFYEIWRYQMTWSFAHEISVHEVHGGDVCVSILAKDAYLNSAKSMMESLGYRNLQTSKEHLGVIETYELDDDMIWTVVAE